MAVFNECSRLVNEESLAEVRRVIGDRTRNGANPFQLVLDTQLHLQKELAQRLPQNGNFDPDGMAQWATCGQMVDYMRAQWDSLTDESRELLTSFGGMSSGEKNATGVWKTWKSNNLELRNRKFQDLSDEDRLEVYFELIDQLHFFANMINALGLSADDMIELYLLKNAENLNRYTNNY
jgi:hypothetical protein